MVTPRMSFEYKGHHRRARHPEVFYRTHGGIGQNEKCSRDEDGAHAPKTPDDERTEHHTRKPCDETGRGHQLGIIRIAPAQFFDE